MLLAGEDIVLEAANRGRLGRGNLVKGRWLLIFVMHSAGFRAGKDRGAFDAGRGSQGIIVHILFGAECVAIWGFPDLKLAELGL
eukprot:6465079-Pyramimonas_sp.AAC.2